MRRPASSPTSCAFASFAALLVLGGCGNPQVKPEDRPPSATADGSLTVVGWSLREQAPLGVQGVVKAEGDREVGAFDSHLDPAQGKTFDHLAAGHYRIEVTRRYAADHALAATSAEEVDIQPGEHVRRELIVDDTQGVSEGAGSSEVKH
jgi:hypothetical protein